jgi:hypothetical protein
MCRSVVVRVPTQPLYIPAPLPATQTALEIFMRHPQEPHIAENTTQSSEYDVNRAYLLGFITTMGVMWCFYLLSEMSWHT